MWLHRGVGGQRREGGLLDAASAGLRALGRWPLLGALALLRVRRAWAGAAVAALARDDHTPTWTFASTLENDMSLVPTGMCPPTSPSADEAFALDLLIAAFLLTDALGAGGHWELRRNLERWHLERPAGITGVGSTYEARPASGFGRARPLGIRLRFPKLRPTSGGEFGPLRPEVGMIGQDSTKWPEAGQAEPGFDRVCWRIQDATQSGARFRAICWIPARFGQLRPNRARCWPRLARGRPN